MTAAVLALLGPIGFPELIIVFLIIFFIFGANRLSGLGRGLGQAISGFKDEIQNKPQEKTEDE